MTFSLADVDRTLAVLRSREGADLAGLSRAELVEFQQSAAAAMRAMEVQFATIAGEVARRSQAEDGRNGLARQQGFTSPQKYVASVLGTSVGEAAKFVRAGAALSSPERTPVADAVRSDQLPLAKANLITRTLDRLEGDTTDLQRRLVEAAKRLDFDQLQRVCSIEAARFDGAAKVAREERQFAERSLHFTEDLDGMTHMRATLDPASAGWIRAWIDAQVAAAFQEKRGKPEDLRTAPQIRVDALVALVQHGMDCESPSSGVKTQLIIRIAEKDLRDDLAMGTCDAVGTAISVKTLRSMAVDAAVLPVVLGSDSRVLDMGDSERLFNWWQRMALAERDGGCSFCHAPVSHCKTHHIQFWRNGGLSDLKNGVLLCTTCHNRIHYDGWDIDVDERNRVWFTPPRHVDPERTRRLGGLAALTV